MSKLFEQLVKARGLSSDFLNPKYEDLKDPFLLPDMKKAIARIKTAIKNQEKIKAWMDEKLVYGVGVSYINPNIIPYVQGVDQLAQEHVAVEPLSFLYGYDAVGHCHRSSHTIDA